MTTRDRLVLMGIAVLAVLAAGWLVVVSPERSRASKIDAQVSAAHAELEAAHQQVADAQGAQAKYSQAYASIVRLGKAVPPDSQIPSLVYQLDQASDQKDVNFASITSTTAAPGAAATPPAGSAATPAAFTAMPFTFIFKGNFFSLYHLFNQVNRFTLRTASGGVQVTGRLLTIQSANLDLQDTGQTDSANSSSSSSVPGELTGTITATAYVLPASQGLTGGATASGPAGQSETTPASSSAPTTPAVARVNP